MEDFVLHVLLIWGLLSFTLILVYDKFVVGRQIAHNMYTGKGRSYNKKKARSTYVKFTLAGGVVAFVVVHLLSSFS
jgi:hypothetical protein